VGGCQRFQSRALGSVNSGPMVVGVHGGGGSSPCDNQEVEGVGPETCYNQQGPCLHRPGILERCGKHIEISELTRSKDNFRE
jgi:hypothetical protein